MAVGRYDQPWRGRCDEFWPGVAHSGQAGRFAAEARERISRSLAARGADYGRGT
jgi:hypothetical protein